MIATETLPGVAQLGRLREAVPRQAFHGPITPNLTPFSFPASNHATFWPNQVFVPLSLYFLVAAAKSRVARRYATGVSPNLPTRSESQPPLTGAARITGSPGKYASLPTPSSLPATASSPP